MNSISRRRFMKISAATISLAAAGKKKKEGC
jgi:hypothetical protein